MENERACFVYFLRILAFFLLIRGQNEIIFEMMVMFDLCAKSPGIQHTVVN